MKPARYLCVFFAAGMLLTAGAGAEETPEPAPAPEAKDMLVTPPPEDRKIEGVPDPAPVVEEPVEEPAESLDAAGAKQGTDETTAADGVVPAPFPLSRYAKLWEHSPFHLESVAPPTESAGLSQQYALTGIAEVSGEPIAFVLERATQLRHMIDKQANTAGLSLVQVDVQAKYADSTATIRRGGEVGVLKFDATAASSGMPGVPPGQQPQFPPGMPQAAIPGQPQVLAAAPPMPGMPVMPPGVVPGVPGPGVPNNGQVSPGQVPGNIPPPRVIRRRAVIPSAP